MDIIISIVPLLIAIGIFIIVYRFKKEDNASYVGEVATSISTGKKGLATYNSKIIKFVSSSEIKCGDEILLVHKEVIDETAVYSAEPYKR